MTFQLKNKVFNLSFTGLVGSALTFTVLSACTASGTVTPNPSPSATPTPGPTASPSVQPTPTPSTSVAPTPTPEPTATATAEPTPTPTATPVTTPVTVYALLAGNQLRRFSSATPSTVTSLAVTGLPGGSTLVGIDFRPADGKLYGITVGTNRLVTIDTNTGAASTVGPAYAPALTSPFIGFDFNPVVDRIRVQGNTAQNLRFNPVTGAIAATDTNLLYADGDINAGATPAISGSAYTNNVSGATSTELYAIDDVRDVLVKFADPNNGAMSTVGPLGINTNNVVGFDISKDGRGFAALRPSGGAGSVFYSINLATGAATQIENIGGNPQVVGIAIAP